MCSAKKSMTHLVGSPSAPTARQASLAITVAYLRLSAGASVTFGDVVGDARALDVGVPEESTDVASRDVVKAHGRRDE